MKKVIKSISVLVLSLSLVFSGFVFAGNVKADEISEWKASAIKTPTEGNLLGAGYIDVEFDNSLAGYTYEVFLDGNPVYWKDGDILRPELDEDESQGTRKTFKSSDTPKTEVYTTSVAKHEITVKATKDEETITSDPVTFYVSKKGLAMGDDMGNKVSLKKLNCSWYYNWNAYGFHNSVDDGVAHMPMIWGGPEEEIQNQVNELEYDSNYILGFNEPDIEGQANMPFFEAVDMWKQYVSPINKRKVSPAPASPGGTSKWLKSFVNGDTYCWLPDGSWDYYNMYSDDPSIIPIEVEGVSDCDAVCLHSYQNRIGAGGLIQAVKNLWRDYKKPVWVTEIGLFGSKSDSTDMSYENAEKRAEIQAFMEEVVTELDKLPYVERYCWFSYDVESANAIDNFDGSGGTSMFEYCSGLYTDLGKAYSEIANPEGYNASKISSNEMFNWDTRVKFAATYNKSKDTAEISWDKGTLPTMPKMDITLDDEPIEIENGGEIDVSALDEGKHAIKFTLYTEDDTTVMVTKTRGFVIDRKVEPTTEAPTQAPTQAPTVAPVKPTVKPTVKPAVVKPGKTTIKGKNVKKKSAKLSWSAVSGAKKYKFNWAMNKKFTKKSKTKIVTKTSYKVKKLKKKKTYYFRVAAINDAGTGPWSNTKKIKIKK
ncbi:MAG: fibronectin type III domain-containing protein [Eubacterium sp.]|nr:fibronectin type III domain-containing protein [Eubacterium sp.]